MSFPIYFDDDAEDVIVVRGIVEAGHDAVRATDAAMRGATDEAHLRFATSQGRAVVTANRGDFLRFHRHFLLNGEHHAGIIILLQQHYSVGEQLRRLLRRLQALSAEQ